MPLYMIERNFPEPLEEATSEEILALQTTNQNFITYSTGSRPKQKLKSQ